MPSGHLATYDDGKCDATRRGTPVMTPILQRDRGFERFDLRRGPCLNRPISVFHRAPLRVQAHSRYQRPACDPPSTWSTSPVTWPACARYNTASMTSLTRAICPIGCKVLRNSFGSFLCIGVSTIPGATALNLIPSLAYSIAKLLITAFSPPLVIIGTAAFTPAIG